MNRVLITEEYDVMEEVYYRPAISIIMPFEPKMGLKSEFAHALEMAVDNVEREVMENFPDELSLLVIGKLHAIIRKVNFNTFKKSIAIFVSPVFEKVMYLDMAVEEKIIIDDSFEIRDLVYNKKETRNFLLLRLHNRESNLYLGNSTTLAPIVSHNSGRNRETHFELPAKSSKIADTSGLREIELDKFLKHVDNGLGIILESYPLPLFVMGAEKILEQFKKLTKHNGTVIDYIPGNYVNSKIPELEEKILPFVKNWSLVKQRVQLNKLDDAIGKKKLAIGMVDVWRQAMRKRGRLLLVEKNYTYAAERGSSDEIIYKATGPVNKYSYIKDAVDDVMEKVLENGGDVEFVDAGLLKNFQHIALILFY